MPSQSAAHDLGPLDGSVLLFGGPYGNLEATRAVLAEAARRGISPARTICSGDVVAYCADPAATVDLLRAAGIHIVAGNVEQSLAADAGDCGCGYAEGSACDRLARDWYGFARAEIDRARAEWMAALPGSLGFTLGGRRLAVVHGAPSAINRYLFPSADDATLAAEIAASGGDGVIGGHSGVPFVRVVEGKLWLNAGVIGLPANDGTPRGWFAVMTPGADGVAVDIHALDYDHRAAAARMRARGLPEGYARALESGVWPSHDAMTDIERAATGRPLSPMSLVW